MADKRSPTELFVTLARKTDQVITTTSDFFTSATVLDELNFAQAQLIQEHGMIDRGRYLESALISLVADQGEYEYPGNLLILTCDGTDVQFIAALDKRDGHVAWKTDRQHLEQAIRQTSVGGSTSLYDAIYISLKELKKVRARTVDDDRRQAIVVLSDGYDTSSVLGFDEVLEQAKRSETSIYSIGLRSRDGRSCKGWKKSPGARS